MAEISPIPGCELLAGICGGRMTVVCSAIVANLCRLGRLAGS